MIDLITFHKPINVGGKDLDSYSKTRDAHTIDVVERGNFLVFWVKAAPNKRVRVPLTNVGHIAETVEDAAAVPAPAKAAK